VSFDFDRMTFTRPRHEKAPHRAGPFLEVYLPRPEPGPVGVKVDPLGDELGPMVRPEGFMVLPGVAVFVVPKPSPVVVPDDGTPVVPPAVVLPMPGVAPAVPAPLTVPAA
jgi:hypothetical protein